MMPDLKPLFYMLALLSIFGLWKLVEFLIWIFTHIKIEVLK